jgi:hypothetical protein
MGEGFQGMTVPEGDPAGLARAAAGFSSIASATAVSATRLESMPTEAGSWIGRASVSHASMCLSHASAARQAGDAAVIVTVASQRYAADLREARQLAREAIRDARDAQERIDRAQEAIEEARGRAAAAERRIDTANHILMVAASAGHPAPGAEAELAAAADEAERAREDERRAQRALERAQDDLQEAKRRYRRADEDAHDAARAAAAAFAQAAAMLPAWMTPPPPPPPPPPEEDKAWYEDALGWTGDQFEGLATGAWDGVKGLGEAGAMIYRASPVNYVFNQDSFEQQWSQLGQGASYAWHHPGEFAKQVVNYEDLSNGRVGEWLGGLAPDAALAFGTAGVGTVASRGSRVAKEIDNAAAVPDTVRKVGGRTPINGRYAGSAYPLPDDLAAKYAKGVTFRETGFPAFTPHREGHAVIDGLTGDNRVDAAVANKAVELDHTPEGWTWHHVEDGRTMELVPSDLHEAVRHTGGAAVIRAGQVGEIPIVDVPPAWRWREGLGVGLGSAGLGQAPAMAGGGG